MITLYHRYKTATSLPAWKLNNFSVCVAGAGWVYWFLSRPKLVLFPGREETKKKAGLKLKINLNYFRLGVDIKGQWAYIIIIVQ